MKNEAKIDKKIDDKYDPSVIEPKWPHSAKATRGKQVNKYDPAAIEPYWQAKWEEGGVYQTDLESANGSTSSPQRKSFYNLMMFPYPSAEGLHMGSVFAFSGVDIYGRFKRMQGYDVFEPIGLDGFGIHSENHAIKTGTHPIDHAKRTEENFYRQLRMIGNGFDWKHKLETYDPRYYKWTQWLFIELFKAGLAYRKKSPVNFCPSCKTVLADEQVIDGKCERCGSVVEKRDLEQWFFRITKYAERLLNNIAKLNWTDKVKIAQRNWIGKRTGINITYEVEDSSKTITVFTTRPDTNFGATFIALAPENPLAVELATTQQKEKVEQYITKSLKKSEIERQAEGREKTGVFTGLYAINRFNGYRMPIWVSDFVLSGFGTGALVGVPAADTRDFEFAQKFGLEVKRVVVGKDRDVSTITRIEQVQEKTGTMVNSGFLDGMDIHRANKVIMDYIEEKGFGKRVTTYHLRDWLISRQRYWGPPIPMIYCEACGKKGKSWFSLNSKTSPQPSPPLSSRRAPSSAPKRRGRNGWNSAGWYPVGEKDLPVKLPYIEDFKPMGTGKSPLANYPKFYETVCPECGGKARRETDVSDTFLDSSWYFLRYLATDWDDMPFPSEAFIKNPKSEIRNPKQIQKPNDQNSKPFRVSNFDIRALAKRKSFLPVHMYIGGAEHSVLHLLYARFITMFLAELGLIGFEEPFARFYAHGLLIKDGAKMSKSRGNVINPDDYIRKFGVDALRAYLHFLGPFNEDGDFRDTGIEGMHRFLKRVWSLFAKTTLNNTQKNAKESLVSPNVQFSSASLRMMHRTIAGVTGEMENLRYNTAIAKLMSWYNFLAKQDSVSRVEAENYLKLLAPFAPHMAEELYQSLNYAEPGAELSGKVKSIHISKWPSYDPKYLSEDVVKIPVQVNGKLREMLLVPHKGTSFFEASHHKGTSFFEASQSEIERMAKESEKVKKYLEGKEIRKVIYVPGKVINFVIGE